MEKTDIEILIVRYLQNTCTRDEKEQFLTWLDADKKNEVVFFEMKELFDSRTRIVKKDPAEKPVRRIPVTYWMGYAATVLLLLGVSLFLYIRKDTGPVMAGEIVIHNTRGVYLMTLPDSSKVWLHGGTTLTYPQQFAGEVRQVSLQGEAYFSVQSDAVHPFSVQTASGIVKATGTEFNITSYPDDRITTATLVKGIVDIIPAGSGLPVRLNPNQQAIWRGGDPDVVVKDVSVDLYSNWRDGIYRFKNEPFGNIALRLEKMFGMDVRIEDQNLETANFSGMFNESQSLREILEIINISNPISYQVKDKTVYIKNRK